LPGPRSAPTGGTSGRFSDVENHQPPGIAPALKKTGFMRLLRPAYLLFFLIAISPPLTFAQGANPAAPQGAINPYEYRLRCLAPNLAANPFKRKFGCKDVRLDTKETLFGFWSGVRNTLLDDGITPTASYIAALQTNLGGPVPQEWNYTGQVSLSFDFDLYKILNVSGLSFYVSAFDNSGGNLSGAINSTFPINTLDAPPFHLGEMYMQESLEDARLLFAAGRIAPNAQFATLPVLGNYVNGSFNANVGNMHVNDPAFIGPPPGVEWGSQIVYKIDTLEFSGGVFNNNLPSARGLNYGAHFALQNGNKGALIMGQITYLKQQGQLDNGVAGEYTVGAFHDGNWVKSLAGPNQLTGLSGLYALGQQMIWRPRGRRGTKVGLTVWGELGYSGQNDRNTMPLFSGAGAAYQGLIPRRSQDSLVIGWIYGGFSKYLPGQSAQQIFELNYQWNVKKGLVVVPDFQRVVKPSGFSVPGTSVFGVQLNFTL
jgi:porin